jgi:hypothetical protein
LTCQRWNNFRLQQLNDFVWRRTPDISTIQYTRSSALILLSMPVAGGDEHILFPLATTCGYKMLHYGQWLSENRQFCNSNTPLYVGQALPKEKKVYLCRP